MKVLHFPLSKITFLFVLGIIFSFYVQLNVTLLATIVSIGFVIFGCSLFLTKTLKKYPLFFTLLIFILSFFLGITTQITHNNDFQQRNYIHLISNSEKEQLLEVVLREKLKPSNYNERYIAIVKKIDSKKSTGKIIVNFSKNKLNARLSIGSNIKIKGKIIKNKTPKNPNQFDYAQYLSNKSIFAQIYVNATDVKIHVKKDQNIWYYSAQLRDRILTNLQKNGFKNKELNVIAALILGQQQDISPEILKDYQFAGAIHILSVSGLHIGFILIFLTFILKPLPKTKFGSYLKLIIIVFSLWSFAVIAGLSPSVVRSVTMFSFVAIGMHLKRKTNIYHTLLISIFVILLCEPSFIFDVGFQLSYVALFFILWLQPLLAELWEPKNKILIYLWDIITVSFAAQIGALPLSIYYFHQFPGLFFITNLIVLPTLGIIMALGLLLMTLAAFNIVPIFLLKIVEWSISTLNAIIAWVASFESFIFQDIAFNKYMLATLYLLIITSIIWFKQPKYHQFIAVLSSFILFQLTYISSVWEVQTKNEFIIFNVHKSTIIGERNGQKIKLFYKESLQNMKMIDTYLTANFITAVEQKPLINFFYFNGQKILVLDQFVLFPEGVKPDVLLITKSPKINLDRIIQKLQPKIVVADASNYKTYIKLWESTCTKLKTPFHSTSEKGFYLLK